MEQAAPTEVGSKFSDLWVQIDACHFGKDLAKPS